jgi:hypothetical protein
VLGTPSPFGLQNLENKRSRLRLWARSLSLQEFREKLENMGVAAEVTSRFGTKLAFWSRGPEAAAARVRLSKTKYYLVDNTGCTRLSDSRRAVSTIKCAAKLTVRVVRLRCAGGLPASKVMWIARNPPVRGYWFSPPTLPQRTRKSGASPFYM